MTLLRPSPAPLIRFNHKISASKNTLYFPNIKSIYQRQFKRVLDLLVNPAHPVMVTEPLQAITGTENPATGGGAGPGAIVRRQSRQATFKAISELKQSDLFTEL